MKQAILKGNIFVSEVYQGGQLMDGAEGISHFENGSIVDVLAQVPSDNQYKQYVIYSTKTREATTVAEIYLDFLNI
jgi:hypothetical protein